MPPTRFGRISAPRDPWLAKAPPEPVLEPEIPIIDTHHHLWDRPDHRYFLDEVLADFRTGHNVVASVFVECHAMYRAAGPEELRSLGQTEFVTGMAAMSESGAYGPTRVAAGIVGFADLMLGDRVEPVLEAHVRAGGGRFDGGMRGNALALAPRVQPHQECGEPHRSSSETEDDGSEHPEGAADRIGSARPLASLRDTGAAYRRGRRDPAVPGHVAEEQTSAEPPIGDHALPVRNTGRLAGLPPTAGR